MPEPDRTWFALAAYNIGYGHVEDARVLTQKAGRDPDSWQDVREFLPLLAQEEWYTQTENGYARGWEPVRYVDNVREYRDLLEWAWGSTGAVSMQLALTSAALRRIPAAIRCIPRCTRPPNTSIRCVIFGFRGKIEDAAAGARLRVPGAEHHPRDTRIDRGADAHGARLQGHVQRCPAEPIVVLRPPRRAARRFPHAPWDHGRDRAVPAFADHGPPSTTSAPTGTSSLSRARRASSSARRMYSTSVGGLASATDQFRICSNG